jgi:chromosome segregation ATPase
VRPIPTESRRSPQASATNAQPRGQDPHPPGLLTDDEVRRLLVRAGRATQVEELFPILRTLTANRVALIRAIQVLNARLETGQASGKKAKAASEFDLALLDQLKLIRDELNQAQETRDRAVSENGELRSRVLQLEEDQDSAQRRAEKAARDLLLATRERDGAVEERNRLSEKLIAAQEELVATTEALQGRLEQKDAQRGLGSTPKGGRTHPK